MRKFLTAVAALVAIQAVFVVGYWIFADRRNPDSALPGEPAARPPLRISTPLPTLALRYRDGKRGELAEHSGRPLLLHFWATWCPPCRKELPSVMALAEDGDVKVLVVGVDEDWEPVRRFLDGPVPPYMALADGGEVEARFGVQELPESFFVDRTGTMKLQFRGARDWNSEATQRLLR